jgi:hypothetical protein
MRAIILSICIIATACTGRWDEMREETQEKIKPYTQKTTVFKDTVWGTGTIETIVDGYDGRKVNLWSSHEEGRTIICSLTRGERVDILLSFGEHYKVRSQRDHNCAGFLMKGWVIRD